jgi:flagellar biosynthetic protein FlhB
LYGARDGVLLTSWIVGVMGALAGLEYFYQRWRTEVQLRMSRQEIKEEMREQEGDPQLKGRVKSLRQKMSRRRMTAQVAKADVVITNPTHLAIALGYRAGEMGAPRVLGKGAGYIAEKIREIARAKGIPIIENKPLAQLLYRRVEVGWEIPETFYRAVAEVLAYVYRLRRGERTGVPKFSAPQG